MAFDIGGVLEVPVDTRFDERWERRLGLAPGVFFERLRRSGLGRAANLGLVTEAGLAAGLAELYGLDRPTTGELLGDLWDWYVGELNAGMAEFFRRLRPRYRTAILSNAAAGGGGLPGRPGGERGGGAGGRDARRAVPDHRPGDRRRGGVPGGLDGLSRVGG